jgi:hypothetical protein
LRVKEEVVEGVVVEDIDVVDNAGDALRESVFAAVAAAAVAAVERAVGTIVGPARAFLESSLSCEDEFVTRGWEAGGVRDGAMLDCAVSFAADASN